MLKCFIAACLALTDTVASLRPGTTNSAYVDLTGCGNPDNIMGEAGKMHRDRDSPLRSQLLSCIDRFHVTLSDRNNYQQSPGDLYSVSRVSRRETPFVTSEVFFSRPLEVPSTLVHKIKASSRSKIAEAALSPSAFRDCDLAFAHRGPRWDSRVPHGKVSDRFLCWLA